jgi:2-methylcitrate dehydratase PrpD
MTDTEIALDEKSVGSDQLGGYVLYPLARWAAELRYDEIPDSVAHEARLSLLDTIGCMIDGFSDPDNQIILAAEREVSAATGPGAATVAVSGDRLTVPAAAKVNSGLAGIHEFDDNTAGHASLVTVPVGLAVAEAHHRSGVDLLTSMVATYEVVGRMFDAVYDNHKTQAECGITPNSAANTGGAAAQTARLLGADAKGVFDAINVGLTFFPFAPGANVKVGAQVKPLACNGWQVFAGTYGALYAHAGLTAAGDCFESEYGGYLRTVVADTWNAAALGEGLGEMWQLDKPKRKRHACCGFIHSSIEATWDILRENDLAVGDIDRIDVELPTLSYDLVGAPPPGELTARGAQFSLPYSLSVALREDRPVAPADTYPATLAANLANPAFDTLMTAIHPAHDADSPDRLGCRLTLTTKDDRQFARVVDDAEVQRMRHLGTTEVEDKFRVLASTQLGEAAIDEIIDMVRNVEQIDDIAALTGLMAR